PRRNPGTSSRSAPTIASEAVCTVEPTPFVPLGGTTRPGASAAADRHAWRRTALNRPGPCASPGSTVSTGRPTPSGSIRAGPDGVTSAGGVAEHDHIELTPATDVATRGAPPESTPRR